MVDYESCVYFGFRFLIQFDMANKENHFAHKNKKKCLQLLNPFQTDIVNSQRICQKHTGTDHFGLITQNKTKALSSLSMISKGDFCSKLKIPINYRSTGNSVHSSQKPFFIIDSHGTESRASPKLIFSS